MKPLPTGAHYRHRVWPQRADLASAIGNSGVDVVSTPATIGYLETTAHLLLQPAYDAHEASVGTRVNVEHTGAAFPGEPLDCSAELIAADGARFDFRVTAHQGERLIMHGEHCRRVIDLQRFLARRGACATPVPRAPLNFWFDVHSPWCYLAALRIGDIARRDGRPLRWRPLHLPSLIDAIDGRRPLEANPAFVQWYRQDLQDCAAVLGVSIVYHPDYPLRNNRALRCCAYAVERNCGEAFALRVLRAYWSEQADISDPGVLQACFDEIGHAAPPVAEIFDDPRFRAAIVENTDEARRQGVFGLPAMVCEGKLFFGNDRLDALERWLRNQP